jgi:protein arginine kinase activator
MSTQLCQHCHANPATLHFTEIQDGSKSELHMCEACAAAQGLTQEAFVSDIVSALTRGVRSRVRRCPHCGITFEEFRAKGRFGCPRDYEVFEDALVPLLRRMHGGADRHTGRLPRGQSEVETMVGDRLLQLRRELQTAVEGEKYEEAARLRDEIQTIERESQKQSWTQG